MNAATHHRDTSNAFILPTLTTEHLLLRAIEESDVESIYSYASNPNVARWTLWEPHQSINDTLSFVRTYILPSYDKGNPGPFGITLKTQSTRVIGTVGCFRIEGHGCDRTMELAYAIDEPYWGQGLVHEASCCLISWVFEQFPETERIQCRCKHQNRASARVMEKLGMTAEGTLRQDIWHRHQHWDIDYCSILRSEWPSRSV